MNTSKSPTASRARHLVVMAVVGCLTALAVGIGSTAAAEPISTRVHPQMCNPYPPDYVGCTLAQTRVLDKTKAREELTGHWSGYKTYGWGQHHAAGTFTKGVSPALRTHLAKIYRAGVLQYRSANNGAWPKYRWWAGFAPHAFGGCSSNSLLHGTPFEFCAVRMGNDGASKLMWAADKVFIGCAGVSAVFAGGAGVTHVLVSGLTGVWRLGFATWGVTTAGCVANHIPVVHRLYEGVYHWFTGLMSKSKAAREAQLAADLALGSDRQEAYDARR